MRCKYKADNKNSFIGAIKHLIFWHLRTLQAKIMRPINNEIDYAFIIGCGNSGTTLLNARLGMNSSIFNIPEETSWFIPKTLSLKSIFNQILIKNKIAVKNNKKVLLEKTPKHVHCMQLINLMIRKKKFIFIIRNPFSTISSLKKRFNSFDIALDRYILDNSILEKNISPVLIVKYEDLVSNRENLMRRICDYLNVEYCIEMSRGESSTYEQVNFHLRDNMSIRKNQVKKEIYDDRLYSVDSLSKDEIKIIYEKTKLLICKYYPDIDSIYHKLK
jgi:hypothetical protein